ncbi:MAG TPA: hypothetical protein DGT21_00255 [Armatimonadetes bacterium]|nr:hypothetical protein [Armatimonadota bacterium]
MTPAQACCRPRRTLAAESSLVGLGVRTGQEIELSIGPAPAGSGITIERTDIGSAWPADLEHALPLPACSSIGDETGRVDFVEHLMAVLWAESITDAHLRLDGPEVPLFDGSATPLLAMLRAGGIETLPDSVDALVPEEPIFHIGDDRALAVLPADAPRFGYCLVHPHELVGHQFAEFDPSRELFEEVVAPARTFATWDELQALQGAGMIAAGSEDNCLVVHDDHYSAEPFAGNAMARHKIVDLIGDLYLLGRPLRAHVIGYRTGHADNRALARLILDTCG